MYKVIGAPKTRAFRVIWMLEELGETYEIVPCGPASETAKQYNPLGKIPSLVDGEAVLTDSVAIMTYLADKHGALTAAAGTVVRAEQDATTLWLIDEMDALLWSFAKHTRILPEDRRIPYVEDGLKYEFSRTAATFESRLKHDFLMGDAFSLPDILATHCLGWAHSVGFPPLGDTGKAYLKRCRSRPAFRAAGAKAA